MASVSVVARKLVRSSHKAPAAGQSHATTPLSPCDQTSIGIATARATFWAGRFDENALEKALKLVLDDLPFLAGRQASEMGRSNEILSLHSTAQTSQPNKITTLHLS